MLIIALGTAFFVGIKATAPDMFVTAKEYFSDYNLMDIRVQSTAGLSDDDIKAISSIDGIQYVSGQKFVDAMVKVNGEIEADIDGTQISTRAYSISPENISNYLNGLNDGTFINRPELISGNYPSAVNECLVDDSELSTPESYKIGSTITLSSTLDTPVQGLNTNEFVIVGVVRSPYYLSFERGNTNIGSGKLGTYIYIPDEAFDNDYYSEIYVTVNGSEKYDPYSEEYRKFIEPYVAAIKSIEAQQIDLRVKTLKPELEKTIDEAELKMQDSSSQVSDTLQQLDSTIATLQDLVDNGPARIKAAELEIAEKYADAQTSIDTNTSDYNAAILAYTEKKALFDQNQTLYNQKSAEQTLQKSAYDQYYAQYSSAQNSLNSLRTAIATTESLIAAGESVMNEMEDAQANAYNNDQIQAVVSMMQVTYPELYNAVRALTVTGLASEVAISLSPYIETQKLTLAQQEKSIQEKQAELDLLGAQLEEKKNELTEATLALANAKSALDSAQSELNTINSTLAAAGLDIQSGALQIQIEKVSAENQLNELKAQISAAPTNLAKAKQQRAEILNGLDAGILEAEQSLKDARALYAKLDSVTWSIYDRDDTPGYAGYGQTVENIEVLSNIFPIFFFIISSLICLTTMRRMVEEDRTILGTYKALGYKTGAIIAKYVIYSLSACIFGTALGVAVALLVFPYSINAAYGIMYSLPTLKFIFPVKYTIIGFAISLACTTFTTMIALIRELRMRPAVLMRPKTPKSGKRILLERIKFLWKRLSFTTKVTMRNLFRNKQRFTMTLFGIAGCSALLLASLGMYNSINAIITQQYNTNPISKYDFQIVFADNQNTAEPSYEYTKAQTDVRVESLMMTSMKAMTGSSTHSDKKLDTYVFVPSDPTLLNEYIDLRDRLTGKKYTLDDTGAIITEKLAHDTKTNVGDLIDFTDGDGHVYSVLVSAIAENYTFHYIYMTPNIYSTVTGQIPQYGYAIGKIASSFKTADKNTLNNAKGLLATDLMKLDGISAVAYTSDTTKSITEVTDALSFVILIFFVSALILAFIVLYNLSNINIIERTRELATLKVLGFVDKEVDRYIYRENIVVSVFGLIFGAGLGIVLHYLLITFTAIDTVMYGQSIAWYSYVISTVITILIIIAVNMILHIKLKKVDMVLSLKSVE